MSDYSPGVLEDIRGGFCGDLIGRGRDRDTFACKFDRDLVVKIESGAQCFQNIIEWETWNRVKGTDYEKWFAPCVSISPFGAMLVMQRTIPAPKYPERMPVFFSDFKRANYGLLKNRFVCHDYGTHLLFENGMSARTKRVEWWDE